MSISYPFDFEKKVLPKNTMSACAKRRQKERDERRDHPDKMDLCRDPRLKPCVQGPKVDRQRGLQGRGDDLR